MWRLNYNDGIRPVNPGMPFEMARMDGISWYHLEVLFAAWTRVTRKEANIWLQNATRTTVVFTSVTTVSKQASTNILSSTLTNIKTQHRFWNWILSKNKPNFLKATVGKSIPLQWFCVSQPGKHDLQERCSPVLEWKQSVCTEEVLTNSGPKVKHL